MGIGEKHQHHVVLCLGTWSTVQNTEKPSTGQTLASLAATKSLLLSYAGVEEGGREGGKSCDEGEEKWGQRVSRLHSAEDSGSPIS